MKSPSHKVAGENSHDLQLSHFYFLSTDFPYGNRNES